MDIHSDGLGSVRQSIPSLAPPLYRFEAHLDIVPIGLVPEGLRMANSFEGEVTEGLLRGARVWGIDHLLLRFDGIAIIDAQKTISLDNTHLHEHVHGYGLPPTGAPLPPVEELLRPDFVWPDATCAVLGTSTFRASGPKLQHLNAAVCRVDGWFNFASGALGVETRLLEHLKQVEPPPCFTSPLSGSPPEARRLDDRASDGPIRDVTAATLTSFQTVWG